MKLEDLRKKARSGELKPKRARTRKNKPKGKKSMRAKCPDCGSHMIKIVERDRDILRNIEVVTVKCMACDAVSGMDVTDEVRFHS